MLPSDWSNFLVNVGKFITISTMIYIVVVVWYAWMKSADDERKRMDRDAEAFQAGYLAGRRGKPISSAYYNFQTGRDDAGSGGE